MRLLIVGERWVFQKEWVYMWLKEFEESGRSKEEIVIEFIGTNKQLLKKLREKSNWYEG